MTTPTLGLQGLRPDPQPDYGKANVRKLRRKKNANNGGAKTNYKEPRACTILIDEKGQFAWGKYSKTTRIPKSQPAV